MRTTRRISIFAGGCRQGLLLTLLAAVALYASVSALHALADVRAEAPQKEKLYYPSGRFLRQAAVGFREMAADYVWFQTVQYYGGFRKGDHDLRYFRGLIDAVLELDPLFIEAYYFAALVLAMDLGDRAGGLDILRRGVLANPENWLLPFEIGFIHYVVDRDFKRASVWFDAAARAPTATDFARRFAAFCHKRAGDLEVSVVLWRNLYETTKDPYMKRLAEDMITRCQQRSQTDASAGGQGRLHK